MCINLLNYFNKIFKKNRYSQKFRPSKFSAIRYIVENLHLWSMRQETQYLNTIIELEQHAHVDGGILHELIYSLPVLTLAPKTYCVLFEVFPACTSLPLGLIPRLSPSLLSLQLYQHCKWQKVGWGTGERVTFTQMIACTGSGCQQPFSLFFFLHRVFGAVAWKFKTVLLWCYSSWNRMSSVSHPHADWWQGRWKATQELWFAGGDRFQP